MELELDATPSISLFSSNIDSNGDLFALVNDCIDLLLIVMDSVPFRSEWQEYIVPMCKTEW